MKDLEDLEFTILVSLVLEHLLDGHTLPGFSDDRLEHHTE